MICDSCREWARAEIERAVAGPRERECPIDGTVIVADERAMANARGDAPRPLPNQAHQDHDGTVSHRDRTETDSGQA